MRLLFDQNLSPRLVEKLIDIFPESSHVYFEGLDRASDIEMWLWAKSHGFSIVTKDADFSELNILRGFPPKIIWIGIGNCLTQQIEDTLRMNFEAIKRLHEDQEIGILVIQ